MNKIVFEHYPASKLPEDMRAKIAADAMVTVEVMIEEESSPDRVMSLDEIFGLDGFRRRSGEEIDADIRRMRDESDD